METRGVFIGPVKATWELLGENQDVIRMGIILRLIQSVFSGIPVVVIVWAIDRMRTDTLTTAGTWAAVLVVVLAVVGQYIFMYRSNAYAWIGTFEAMGEARLGLLRHLQRLPIGTVAGRGTGAITANLTTDIDMVSQFAHGAMPVLFGGAALPVVVLMALAFIDIPLALAVGVSILVAIPLFTWTNQAMKALGVERSKRLASANSRMIEYVQGIGVARAFSATGRRHKLFVRSVEDVHAINDAAVVKLVPLMLMSMGVVQLGVPVVIAATSYWLFGGRIDIGTGVIFLVLMLRVYQPLLQVAGQIESVRLADASLARIAQLQSLEPRPEVAGGMVDKSDATVRFESVTFGYEADTPVLGDVSFAALPGSTTAIVGPSGSGKSTILNLISRFWDPDAGSVTIGGVDLRDMSESELFDYVTVVFQNPYLFQGTIWDNISFGMVDATDDDVIAAAKAAQAHDFIEALPDGYQTRIGEGGATLSGGERQRVSIARALVKNAPVVLLDEATASMDPINEQLVQEGLAALVGGRTLIVVAHRLSTIRSADQILVLDRIGNDPAEIVQRGSHDELIDQPGLYRHLWSERERAERWHVGASADV